MTYEIVFTRKAEEDLKELTKQGYRKKVRELVEIQEKDPSPNPLKYKSLTGEMKGMFSRRINIEHRIIYEIIPAEDDTFEGTVKVHRLRTDYKGLVPISFSSILEIIADMNLLRPQASRPCSFEK